jgi:carbonic anhydrase/acetyltransferase-like protein (isoleucine patch superfamily)
VVIGANSSVWYGTVIRGDVMPIRVGERTSIQDNTVIHVTSDFSGTIIGSDCTVGHSAIIHACTVEDFCLIGMGSIILDGARIGRGSLVGAGALVTPGTDIPPGSLVVGSPAKVKRPVNDKEREQIAYGAQHYVELAQRYRE